MNSPLHVAAAWRSELGRRKSNEDKVRVCREGPRWLAVLADGAGGHHNGAEASRRAVESLETSLCEGEPVFCAQVLADAVHAAHDEVQQAQGDSHGIARMHTTVVVLWVDTESATALWSHVGDSRLYLVRGPAVAALTSDDSVVQRMVDAGLITPEQAHTHPQKNQLIAALGIEDGVDPHTPTAPQEVFEGDAFLLCSDGWWDVVAERDIVASLASAMSPDDWLQLMQEQVETVAAPRQDNFSAIGVWIREPQETTVPMTMPMPSR